MTELRTMPKRSEPVPFLSTLENLYLAELERVSLQNAQYNRALANVGEAMTLQHKSHVAAEAALMADRRFWIWLALAEAAALLGLVAWIVGR